MYKILIADDETKVCQLIFNLVDWESLGIEVVGLVHDGVSALNLIEEKEPDIVITDIRMPGYSGIELIKKTKAINPHVNFIIVSGYRHFDYAHNAIKYGVEDYLLKPLKKTDLLATLQKMLDRFHKNSQNINETESLKRRLEDDREKLKTQFIKNLFIHGSIEKQLTSIEVVNKEYGLHFTPDYFQAFVVKPDIQYSKDSLNAYDMLLKKSAAITRKNIQPYCNELMIHQSKEGIFCLVNFGEEEGGQLRKQLKLIIDQITGLRDVFLNVTVTIGLGPVITELSQLSKTVSEAKQIILNRMVIGTGKILEGPVLAVKDNKNVVTGGIRHDFLNALEVLDKDAVIETIGDIRRKVEKDKHITGVSVFEVCQEIIHIFIFGIKAYISSQEEKEIISQFHERFYMARNTKDAFVLLEDQVDEIINNIAELKKQKDSKPIREAKHYMQENYFLPLSLEDVSNRVGFNAAYFSTLFKKETEQNFLEYLVNIRIQNAKRMLTDTSKSIVQVAEDVGYKDLKHFSKVFKKSTGLTPSEYRKLYY